MGMPLRRFVGYAALLGGALLFFDTEESLRTGLSPLYIPMYANNEICLASIFLGAGLVMLFGPSLARMIASYGAGDEAKVEPGFEAKSVEERRRKRLPLRRRLAALPDRGVIFGMPVMVLLVVMTFLNLPPTPRGIYVAIAPRGTAPAPTNSETPVIVQVELRDKSDLLAPRIRVQGNEVAADALPEILKQEFARRGSWVVFIYGDANLNFQSVASVVDVVNGLGARPVLVGRRGSEPVIAPSTTRTSK